LELKVTDVSCNTYIERYYEQDIKAQERDKSL